MPKHPPEDRVIFTEAAVAEALTRRCEIGGCNAKPGQPCTNPCTGKPMPDRTVHFYRLGDK